MSSFFLALLVGQGHLVRRAACKVRAARYVALATQERTARNAGDCPATGFDGFEIAAILKGRAATNTAAAIHGLATSHCPISSAMTNIIACECIPSFQGSTSLAFTSCADQPRTARCGMSSMLWRWGRPQIWQQPLDVVLALVAILAGIRLFRQLCDLFRSSPAGSFERSARAAKPLKHDTEGNRE